MLLRILALSLFSFTLKAAIPTSGPFIEDTANEFVQDRATQAISTAQQIFCFMGNTRPDSQVNAGNYIAWIDEAKCDTSGRASATQSSNQLDRNHNLYSYESYFNSCK